MLTSLAAIVFATAFGGTAALSGDTTLALVADSVRVMPSDSAAVRAGPRQVLTRVAAGRWTTRSEARTSAAAGAAQRRRAIEHSDWYYKRLAIHKAASFATAPLFVAEYLVGEKLFDDDESSGILKSTHQTLATGIGVLFGVNTVTGVWNLWDTRHEPEGRARRFTHAALMLAADAGFVATASLAPESEDRDEGEREESSDRNRHRTVALTSMGVSLASYVMMYLWK
jgi:hypothetical protein